MSLTIHLSAETEKKLRDWAAQAGQSAEGLAERLLEKVLATNGQQLSSALPGSTLDEILAPFRKEVQGSGMTDDQLRDFFTEVRDEVRAERRAKRPQGKTGG